MWRLPKKPPRASARTLHPYHLMQLPNAAREEGGMLPCHRHKGQVEAATDMDSPWVNFAKPP